MREDRSLKRPILLAILQQKMYLVTRARLARLKTIYIISGITIKMRATDLKAAKLLYGTDGAHRVVAFRAK